MTKRGTPGNSRKQNRRVLHLPANLGPEKIPLRASLHELLEGNRTFGMCAREILEQNRTDLIFVAGEAVPEQIANHRAEEKPPQIERAVESLDPKRFDDEAALAERFCGALDSGTSLRSCHAEGIALE